jgi:hypothetical protein
MGMGMGMGRILYSSTIRVWLWYFSTLPIAILSSYVTSPTFLLQVRGAAYPLEHIDNPSSLKNETLKVYTCQCVS